MGTVMENLEQIASMSTPLMLSDAEREAVRHLINMLLHISEICEDGTTIPIYCDPSFALVFATIIENGLSVTG